MSAKSWRRRPAVGILSGMITTTLLLAALVQDVKPRPSKGTGGKTGEFADLKITVGSRERSYRAYVPREATGKNPVPVVFIFHGRGSTKEQMHAYLKFDDLAKKNKFITVYPDSIGGEWELKSAKDNPDLDFFDALLSELGAKYNIDLARVYATGFSMGGYFSNLVGCTRSDTLAAIAPHSGGLGLLAFTGVKAERKIPALVIHGDADNVVPVEEGRKTKDAYEKAEHPVEYVEIKKLRHEWAHGEKINAAIWAFFEKHPLPED